MWVTALCVRISLCLCQPIQCIGNLRLLKHLPKRHLCWWEELDLHHFHFSGKALQTTIIPCQSDITLVASFFATPDRFRILSLGGALFSASFLCQFILHPSACKIWTANLCNKNIRHTWLKNCVTLSMSRFLKTTHVLRQLRSMHNYHRGAPISDCRSIKGSCWHLSGTRR